MKKYLRFLSAGVLVLSAVFISSCGDDDDGGSKQVPPAKIKTIAFNDGSAIESWEFFYDEEDRVSSITNIYDDGDPATISYDYSVAGELTITKDGGETVYALDGDGRVVKEFWNEDKTEWESYQYNSDGRMVKIFEHYDAADHLKYDLTIESDNLTHRIRYDGEDVVEDREFTYTIGNNASGIHQTYAIDSEWKNIAGLYGKQSKKLVAAYVRHITSDPTSTFGATYEYTFDDDDRVATQTKNGVGSGGSFTESWAYTYYPDED